MKNIKYIFLITITLILFTSCTIPNQNNNNNNSGTVNVTIIYGYDLEDVTYSINKGEKLTLNEDIYNFGKIINYTKEDGTIFNLDEKITKDLTLYANFELNEYTCTFYDYDRKTIIEKLILKHGEKVIYPNNPEDKRFEGYTLEFTKWSRTIDSITNNTVIYAEYKTVYNLINVNIKDQDKNIYEVEEVLYGGTLNEPTQPPLNKEEGYYYQFLGWYNEETNELFDFNQEIKTEITIYPQYKVGKITKLPLESSTISILGDSISTFYSTNSDVNSYYGGTNQFYYPIYSATVKTVEKTWWYQTYTKLGAKLGINNSWSGSSAYGASSSAGMNNSRLETLDNNGTPNIVIIYLGTNDNVNGHTTEQLKEAYEKMINYITTNYTQEQNNEFIVPDIYIVNNGYSSYNGYYYKEETRNNYNNLFKELANTYNNVKLFDLAALITKNNYSTYLGDSLHYNETGMNLIADNLTKQIKEDYQN